MWLAFVRSVTNASAKLTVLRQVVLQTQDTSDQQPPLFPGWYPCPCHLQPLHKWCNQQCRYLKTLPATLIPASVKGGLKQSLPSLLPSWECQCNPIRDQLSHHIWLTSIQRRLLLMRGWGKLGDSRRLLGSRVSGRYNKLFLCMPGWRCSHILFRKPFTHSFIGWSPASAFWGSRRLRLAELNLPKHIYTSCMDFNSSHIHIPKKLGNLFHIFCLPTKCCNWQYAMHSLHRWSSCHLVYCLSGSRASSTSNTCHST